jgi:adenine phosphoribosyltransferase
MHPFEAWIRTVPDFPKTGIQFKDVTPLLKERFHDVIKAMSQNIAWNEIDYVVGIESRGFILGAAMAALQGKGFIPVRKKGKLPPPVISEDYLLEYGVDTLEMGINTQNGRVVIVDDVLATGGTMGAAIKLCKRNGFTVKSLSLLINLKFLNQMKEEGYSLHSVIDYD